MKNPVRGRELNNYMPEFFFFMCNSEHSKTIFLQNVYMYCFIFLEALFYDNNKSQSFKKNCAVKCVKRETKTENAIMSKSIFLF